MFWSYVIVMALCTCACTDTQWNHIFLSLPWWAFLVAYMVKNLPATWETGFHPWVGKIPWRRKWQPSPVFLPGEFHGQRSLVGYSPWGCKELDLTEQLSTHPTPFLWIRFWFKGMLWLVVWSAQMTKTFSVSAMRLFCFFIIHVFTGVALFNFLQWLFLCIHNLASWYMRPNFWPF